jgi:ribose/xylose/arabinose/galactoside ABC-type transport system permease subunit
LAQFDAAPAPVAAVGQTVRKLAPNPALVLLVIACIIFGVFEPNFLSLYNLANLAEQASALGVMTIGLALVLLIGGIDLSIPAIMACSAVVGAMAMVATQNPVVGPLIMIVVGLFGGFVNGFAIAVLGLVPFAVTLATMTLAGGFAVWMTEGTSIYGMPSQYSQAVMSRIDGVPVSVIGLLILTLFLDWVIKAGMLGRWVFAVGTNRRTAEISGIPILWVELGSYLLSGLLAGMAGILLTARLDSAGAAMGSDVVFLDVVASAVIGGVSIYGGRGSIIGAAVGAVFITVVGNGMDMLGFDYFTATALKGVIILLALLIDAIVTRVSKSV